MGISITSFSLTRNAQVVHGVLSEVAHPFNRLLHGNGALARALDPSTIHGAAALDQMINRQALIVAYNDDFLLMTWVTIPTLVLLALMRRAGAPRR